MSDTIVILIAVVLGLLLSIFLSPKRQGRSRQIDMSQVKHRMHIPKVTAADVHRIVERDYPPEQHEAVLSILNEYGSQKWHREKDRVLLAVLKLAQGQLDALRCALDVAKIDFRDVITPAEHPAYSMHGFRTFELPAEQQEQIIASDKEQYEQWLRPRA